jgi:hypothetical protein
MQDMEKDVHSHEWWLPYIEECRSLNISLSDYCEEKGFCYDAFYWHWIPESKEDLLDGLKETSENR